jgi:mono/diheme cytochrome c family protein
MKTACGGALAIAMLSLGGCKGAASPAAGTLEDRGARIYARACVGCHGEEGDGRGSAAAALRQKPRSFVADDFRSAPKGAVPTDNALLEVLRAGVPESGMPSFAYLRDDELRAVIAYLKRFFARRAPR